MNRCKLIASILILCSVAFGQAARPFALQVQNNGSSVGTVTGVAYLNLVSGCTATQSGNTFNITCTGGGGGGAWSGITSGTNAATLLEGTGGSLFPTILGQVAGTQFWAPQGYALPVLTVNNTGGSLANGVTVFVTYTLNSAAGESNPATETSVSTGASCTGGNQCSVTVTAPTLPPGFNSYTVYSQTLGTGSGFLELRQIANNACVAITGNCIIQLGGTGTQVANANTSIPQPSTLGASICPPSVTQSMFLQDTSGEWWGVGGVDPYVGTTGGTPPGPPGPGGGNNGGKFTFCQGFQVNDTFSVPQAGKNALVAITHNWGQTNTTVNTNQDRAMHIYTQTSTTDSAAHYGLEGIQAEGVFQCASCSVFGSPDGEISMASFTMTDNHTGTIVSPDYGFNGERILMARNNSAGNFSGCSICYAGLRIFADNGVNSDPTGVAGIQTNVTGSGYVGTTYAFAAEAPTTGNRATTANYGFWTSGWTTNQGDWAFYTQSGMSLFPGQDVLGSIYPANGGTLPIVGSVTSVSSLSTTQYATPTGFIAGNIVPVGTGGAATWTYCIVERDANGGQTPCSATASTTVGNATLTGGNYNHITWNLPTGTLPAFVDVYRTVSGGTPSTLGLIGTYTVPTYPNNLFQPTYSNNLIQLLNDTGLAGNSASTPTVNTTGDIAVAGPQTGLSLALSDTAANNDLSEKNTTPTVTGAATTVALSSGTAPTNVGNVWTYTLAATESGAGSNAWVGASVTASGWTGGATGNNGTFVISTSTTTTVAWTNASGTATNTGTPVIISSAVSSSPTYNISGTVNTGTAGTLNSAIDTWTFQDVINSVVPNPITKLALTHAGSSGTAFVQVPNLQFPATGLQFDVNSNGGVINFSQQNGISNAGKIAWATGPGAFGLGAIQVGKTLFLESNFTSQAGSLFAVANTGSLTATSGNVIGLNVGGAAGGTSGTEALTWAPASGTGVFIGALVAPTIGGTSSGNTFGLQVNPVPTLTNLSGLNYIFAAQNNGTNEFTVDYSGNTITTGTQTSGVAGGAPNVNKSDYAILASDMGTISSATLVPITNMTWTIAASKNYVLDCEIFLTAATSGTAAFGLIGPGTPTSYTLSVDGNVGTALAYNSGQINAAAAWTSTATPATGAFASTSHVHVRAGIQNGSTGGTLTLDYSNPAAGGTLKANANSWCRLTGVN